MLNLVFILRPPIWTARARSVAVSLQSPANSNSSPRPSSSSYRRQTNNIYEQPNQQAPNTTSFLNLQDDYKTLLDYLTRWRWAMKISSRGAGGRKGLMNLSLLRLDALLSELSYSSTADTDGESHML